MAQVASASSVEVSESAAALAEVASNPIIAGILGPNTDGRVRNPVPSKLKGKTDKKQGNFGVMHMGVTPVKKTDAAAERDAAARRTSENTAQRAKAAQTDKYVPPRKRGLEAMLKEEVSANRASPFSGREDLNKRSRPLAPDETKYEQARLLTLLRSINPITVVDQLCKAVAYFGGIPGAPPPEDGIFPESANTKETGALFIGWLAEIFPDLSRQPEASPEDPSSGAKKKGRSNQGKGFQQPADRFSLNAPPNSANGYGYGPAINPPSWGLPPSVMPLAGPMVPAFLPDPTPAPPAVQQQTPAVQQNSHAVQESTETPAPKQVLEDFLAGASSASKRRRGRPKGSRNKGKSEGQPADNTGTHPGQTIRQVQVTERDSNAPATQQEAAQNTPKDMPPAIVALPTAPASSAPAPTPQVRNPYHGQQYTVQAWQASPKDNSAAVPVHDDVLSPEERAVLEAFRPQGGVSNASAVLPAEAVQPKKRKRAPPKPKPLPIPTEVPVSGSSQLARNTTAVPPPEPSPAVIAQDALQWSTEMQTIPALHPAKRPRQRKPKAAVANETPPLNHTTSIISNDTQPTAASTIPDSTAGSSQQSIPVPATRPQSVPVTRPPAEGLEAHYERFANLQPQNGRSNTPTITSQQQIRQQQQQQQRAAPITATSSQPQQHQMQQQKSQQGTQREEQMMTQASVARSSSTPGFYNQQSSNRTSYSQQYPSHQPSKASYATHQVSPQMGNTSYRSAASLTQASSAYSQAESTYRTASPHTVSQPQPSPSFSTSDTTNFRTNHVLAQPSPTYSQAGSTYSRTSSASNIAHSQSHTQPSITYSSGRTQSQSHQPSHQPSHQTHYSTFTDSSYIDLPTLESLGHSASNAAGNTMSASAYGHQSSVGVSRAGGGSSGLYGTSSTGGLYDMASSAASRPALGTGNALTAAFDAVESQREMREQMIRGYKR